MMHPPDTYADSRLSGYCVYCGGLTESRDHVPSKVFLDKPYPDALPTVECCNACNAGFSLDEEYLACFLEVVRVGSVTRTDSMRRNVGASLMRNPRLSELIRSAEDSGYPTPMWAPDTERVERIIRKLAQGHAAFELSAPCLGAPDSIEFQPLTVMTTNETDAFQFGEPSGLWGEVGSRSFQRQADSPFGDPPGWIEVQPDRYRYAASEGDSIYVRIVIGEYLACAVRW